MTGAEMVEYINKLSSSIQRQSKTGNFGVGAKISAAPANPHGMIYLSWTNGKGAMIHLFRDSANEKYGLRRLPNDEFWAPIPDDLKPEPDQGSRHDGDPVGRRRRAEHHHCAAQGKNAAKMGAPLSQ